MRRSWIIVLSIFVIFLLAVRAIYVTIHRGDDEREWFLDNLKYDFGARIDSVTTRGNRKGLCFIYFHDTHGKFDPGVASRLDRQLKHRHVNFIRSDGDGYQFVSQIKEVQAGDSIAINSGKNSIIVYRSGKQIAAAKVENSTYGKPFR